MSHLLNHLTYKVNQAVNIFQVILLATLSLFLISCSDSETDSATVLKTATVSANDDGNHSQLVNQTANKPASDVKEEQVANDSDVKNSSENLETPAIKEARITADGYKTLDWVDLIPADELNLLMNPPDYLDDVEDGSIDDNILSQIKSQLNVDQDDPYQQALVSTNIIDNLNNELIRLPGFIVPIGFGDSDYQITQFFIVPYFGACMHMPPPPPNQIIFVDHPKGIKMTALYDAFWFKGKITTRITENDTATAAYSLRLDEIKPYTED